MKAWRVTWRHAPDQPAIVAAVRRGQATYATYLRCQDMQRATRITDFATVRAPEYDRFIDDTTQAGQALGWLDARTGARSGCCAALAAEEQARLAEWNQGAPIQGDEQ